MVAVINSGSGGDLNPGGFDGSGGPIATAIAIVRTTSLSSSLGSNLLAGQSSYGYDQVSGSARVVSAQSLGSIGDAFTLTMGAGNNLTRFHGTLRQFDTSLAPHAVSMVGKGPLYILEEFENSVDTTEGDSTKPGIALEDLTGNANGSTLSQIVSAVLSQAGGPSFSTVGSAPSFVYGTLAPEELTWGVGETAAAYLHKVFEASEGWRLYDSADGNAYLQQITAVPAGTPDFTFTLGDDIFADSSASDSSLSQKQAVLVNGWDDGSGPATSGVVGSGSSIFRVTSTLIETDAQATAVANYWLPIVDRRQQVVRLTTPRDYLLGPGQTIYVDAQSGLATNGKMWLKSVTTELSEQGFTQRLVCVVGA